MEQRKARPLNAEALWGYALKVLGGRAYSTGELRVKLQRRAENPSDVEPMIARLKDIGYLNDQRFAEGYANARLSGDKFGKTRVIQDLRHRRVAPELAERTVQHVYADVDEQSLIDDWIQRKYRKAPREGLFEQPKDFASAYRRLARAGFRSGEVVKALKRYAKNPELLDGFEPPEETEAN
jgi:regulatory protein